LGLQGPHCCPNLDDQHSTRTWCCESDRVGTGPGNRRAIATAPLVSSFTYSSFNAHLASTTSLVIRRLVDTLGIGGCGDLSAAYEAYRVHTKMLGGLCAANIARSKTLTINMWGLTAWREPAYKDLVQVKVFIPTHSHFLVSLLAKFSSEQNGLFSYTGSKAAEGRQRGQEGLPGRRHFRPCYCTNRRQLDLPRCGLYRLRSLCSC
jgi:hypothetical protein